MIAFIRWSRSFHRWIAYGAGAIVALWVITGIVMILPAAPLPRGPRVQPLDLSLPLRAPHEAAQALPEKHPPVRSLTIRDLGGRLVYHFVLQNARHMFVDARTAQRIEFSDSLATALARRVMRDSSVGTSATRLTSHDERYPQGLLPAYRIALDDGSGTLIHVAADGSINATSSRSRFKTAMGQLHTFQFPGVAVPGWLRKLALYGTSISTIVLIISGYALVLPKRWRS